MIEAQILSLAGGRAVQQLPVSAAPIGEWPSSPVDLISLGSVTGSYVGWVPDQDDEKKQQPSGLGSVSLLPVAQPTTSQVSLGSSVSGGIEPFAIDQRLLGSAQYPGALVDEIRLAVLDFAALESAANRGDVRSFVAAEQLVNWSRRSAVELKKATRYALSLGAFSVARQLAELGRGLYGDDQEFRQLDQMLAPAKVLRTDLPPDPRVLQNREWLKKHAAEHRNRWVALRDGQLLFSADSLLEVASNIHERVGVLLMRIP